MKTPSCLLVAALLFAGCSSIEVTMERDRDADLHTPRAWAWMADQDLGQQGGREDRQNTYAAVVQAVEDCLAQKGWTRKPSAEHADIVLAFQIDSERAVSVTAFHDYDTSPWSWSRFNGGAYPSSVNVRNYAIGTLVLDMVGSPGDHLLWRGTARAEVDLTDTRAVKATLAADAVRKMFETFPGR